MVGLVGLGFWGYFRLYIHKTSAFGIHNEHCMPAGLHSLFVHIHKYMLILKRSLLLPYVRSKIYLGILVSKAGSGWVDLHQF